VGDNRDNHDSRDAWQEAHESPLDRLTERLGRGREARRPAVIRRGVEPRPGDALGSFASPDEFRPGLTGRKGAALGSGGHAPKHPVTARNRP
jgi:hypothetical protein